MDGERHSVLGADGVPIGLLTAGSGPALLLVHGGMGSIARWEPVWTELSRRWQVTAMDRRGRGTSGDAAEYALAKEADDIAAVAAMLAERQGSAVDVFGHSYGATCALAAAAGPAAASIGRLALYEPPGPQTVSAEWLGKVTGFVRDGQPGRAMFSFLTEVVGLTAEQIADLRAAPGGMDVLAVVTATMPREGRALREVGLAALAAAVTCPGMLLLGELSPPWAGEISRLLRDTIALSQLVILSGQAHEAIADAPQLIVDELDRFLLGGVATAG